MTRREYPRAGESNARMAARATCFCGVPTQRAVWVQVSWFRGDDVVIPACEPHRRLARRDLSGFLRAYSAATATP
jgi:hypothetical protein